MAGLTVQKQIKAELSRLVKLNANQEPSSDLDLSTLPLQTICEVLPVPVENLRGLEPNAWVATLLNAASLSTKGKRPPEEIVSLYQTILEIDPHHREAVFALGVLYFDLNRPKDLIALYRKRIQKTDNLGEKVSLHLYIAEALDSQLSEHEAAFMEVVTAARLDPRNLRIINQLEKLGRRANRDQEVTVVLGELLLHAVDPHIRAGLALRLAELCLSSFDQPERALAYYRSALFDDGGDPTILQEIKDVFHETHRFVELGRHLDEVSRDRRTSPPRSRMQQELVHLYREDQSNPTRALETLLHSIKQNPDDRRLLDEMSELANANSDYELLAEALKEIISCSRNPLLVHFAHRRLGQLYINTLNDPQKAIQVYEELLDQHPNHLEVLHCLGQLYFEHRSPEQTITVYRRILSLQPNDSRARAACTDLSEMIHDENLDHHPPLERETSQ